MIELLSCLWDAYWSWRTAAPAMVSMALGPLAALGISLGAGFLGDLLFGGPSSQEKQALAAQSQASDAEIARIQQQMEVIARLMELARSPSAMQGILGATGGQGFTLPRSLEAARMGNEDLGSILGAIDFTGEREKDILLSLLGGIPTSLSATNLGAQQAFASQAAREQSFGDLSFLIASLLSRPGTRRVGGGLSVAQDPVFPSTTGGSVFF